MIGRGSDRLIASYTISLSCCVRTRKKFDAFDHIFSFYWVRTKFTAQNQRKTKLENLTESLIRLLALCQKLIPFNQHHA